MQIHEAIAQFQPFGGDSLHIETGEAQTYVVENPTTLTLRLAAEATARVVVRHTTAIATTLEVELGERSRLTLVELFEADAHSTVKVSQQTASNLRLTAVQYGSSEAHYTIDLVGREATSQMGGLFLVGAAERSRMTLRTNHLVSDCRSDSVVRGLAGGEAVGHFAGMVYVAQDAQRTDAGQQNRNMLLSPTARIETMPQLEIYADDVKCSHGATVGQMDSSAIYYMRQRGLNEQQARALQIRGFAAEVLMHCGIDPLCEAMLSHMEQKLETI